MDKDLILIIGGVLVTAVVLHGMWLTLRARRDRLPVHLAADVPEAEYEDGDILGPARVVPSPTDQAPLGLWNARDFDAGEATEFESPLLAPVASQGAYAVSEASVGARLGAGLHARFAEPAARVADVLATPIVPSDTPPVGRLEGEPIIPSVSPALAAAVGSDIAEAPTAVAAVQGSGGNGSVPDAPARGDHMAEALQGAEAAALAPDANAVASQDAEPKPEVVGDPAPAVAAAATAATAGTVQPPQVEEATVVTTGERDTRAGRTRDRSVGRTGERASANLRDRSTRERKQGRGSSRSEGAPDLVTEEVFVINVLARNGGSFNGADLFEVFMRNALKFRDMNIFHRLDPVSGAVRFSVANAVEPGIFDLSDMASLETPGVSLFFRLPGPEQPGAVLDDMLLVARDIGKSLGGDLKDENMSVLTGQTLSHFKQRMVEFSRKRMSMRAANG